MNIDKIWISTVISVFYWTQTHPRNLMINCAQFIKVYSSFITDLIKKRLFHWCPWCLTLVYHVSEDKQLNCFAPDSLHKQVIRKQQLIWCLLFVIHSLISERVLMTWSNIIKIKFLTKHSNTLFVNQLFYIPIIFITLNRFSKLFTVKLNLLFLRISFVYEIVKFILFILLDCLIDISILF